MFVVCCEIIIDIGHEFVSGFATVIPRDCLAHTPPDSLDRIRLGSIRRNEVYANAISPTTQVSALQVSAIRRACQLRSFQFSGTIRPF